MVHSNNPSVLKTKEGRFVTVRRSEGKLRLCAVEGQNNQEPEVYIEKRDSNHIALHFKHGGKYYLPTVDVDGNSLLLEMAGGNISDRHLFKKDDNLKAGNHYRLQSVVAPSKFLAIDSSQTMQHNLVLSQQWVLVTDEKACIRN